MPELAASFFMKGPIGYSRAEAKNYFSILRVMPRILSLQDRQVRESGAWPPDFWVVNSC